MSTKGQYAIARANVPHANLLAFVTRYEEISDEFHAVNYTTVLFLYRQ